MSSTFPNATGLGRKSDPLSFTDMQNRQNLTSTDNLYHFGNLCPKFIAANSQKPQQLNYSRFQTMPHNVSHTIEYQRRKSDTINCVSPLKLETTGPYFVKQQNGSLEYIVPGSSRVLDANANLMLERRILAPHNLPVGRPQLIRHSPSSPIINLAGSTLEPPNVSAQSITRSMNGIPPLPPPRSQSTSSTQSVMSTATTIFRPVVDVCIVANSITTSSESQQTISTSARTGVATRFQHTSQTNGLLSNRSELTDTLLRLLMRRLVSAPNMNGKSRTDSIFANSFGPDFGSLKRFFATNQNTRKISDNQIKSANDEAVRLMTHLIRIIYTDDHHAQSIEGFPIALNVMPMVSAENPNTNGKPFDDHLSLLSSKKSPYGPLFKYDPINSSRIKSDSNLMNGDSLLPVVSHTVSSAHLLDCDEETLDESELSDSSSDTSETDQDFNRTPSKHPNRSSGHPLISSSSESGDEPLSRPKTRQQHPPAAIVNPSARNPSKNQIRKISRDKSKPDKLGEYLSLPSGTSLKHLKCAALHALSGLVLAAQTNDQLRERDLSILNILSCIHTYYFELASRLINTVRAGSGFENFFSHPSPLQQAPVTELAAVVRLSFQPELREVICQFGGVYALVNLLRWEHALWQERRHYLNSKNPHSDIRPEPASIHNIFQQSLSLRRYICMALTNLTFGVLINKAIVCRRRLYLEALVSQLETNNEDLKQVAASVLRNLSWKTDAKSRQALRRVDAPHRLMIASMASQKDNTLRTTLSALWNLSSHCVANKQSICSVNGFLQFFINLISNNDTQPNTPPNSDSSAVAVIESAAGILRNLSSIITMNDEYRRLFRIKNGYFGLLKQLRTSNNLTVLVNCTNYLQILTEPRLNERNLKSWAFEEDMAHLHEIGAVEVFQTLMSSNVLQNRSLQQSLEETLTHLLSWQPPAELSTKKSVEEGNDSESVSTAELVFRRRRNARPRDQRFGYLSVVFETDSDDQFNSSSEEDADLEEDTECEDSSDINQMTRSCIGEEEQKNLEESIRRQDFNSQNDEEIKVYSLEGDEYVKIQSSAMGYTPENESIVLQTPLMFSQGASSHGSTIALLENEISAMPPLQSSPESEYSTDYVQSPSDCVSGQESASRDERISNKHLINTVITDEKLVFADEGTPLESGLITRQLSPCLYPSNNDFVQSFALEGTPTDARSLSYDRRSCSSSSSSELSQRVITSKMALESNEISSLEDSSFNHSSSVGFVNSTDSQCNGDYKRLGPLPPKRGTSQLSNNSNNSSTSSPSIKQHEEYLDSSSPSDSASSHSSIITSSSSVHSIQSGISAENPLQIKMGFSKKYYGDSLLRECINLGAQPQQGLGITQEPFLEIGSDSKVGVMETGTSQTMCSAHCLETNSSSLQAMGQTAPPKSLQNMMKKYPLSTPHGSSCQSIQRPIPDSQMNISEIGLNSVQNGSHTLNSVFENETTDLLPATRRVKNNRPLEPSRLMDLRSGPYNALFSENGEFNRPPYAIARGQIDPCGEIEDIPSDQLPPPPTRPISIVEDEIEDPTQLTLHTKLPLPPTPHELEAALSSASNSLQNSNGSSTFSDCSASDGLQEDGARTPTRCFSPQRRRPTTLNDLLDQPIPKPLSVNIPLTTQELLNTSAKVFENPNINKTKPPNVDTPCAGQTVEVIKKSKAFTLIPGSSGIKKPEQTGLCNGILKPINSLPNTSTTSWIQPPKSLAMTQSNPTTPQIRSPVSEMAPNDTKKRLIPPGFHNSILKTKISSESSNQPKANQPNLMKMAFQQSKTTEKVGSPRLVRQVRSASLQPNDNLSNIGNQSISSRSNISRSNIQNGILKKEEKIEKLIYNNEPKPVRGGKRAPQSKISKIINSSSQIKKNEFPVESAVSRPAKTSEIKLSKLSVSGLRPPSSIPAPSIKLAPRLQTSAQKKETASH